MPITTTPSERIGLCTKMRRFLVRFIRPESFVHTRSSAGFTITTSEFKFFGTHTDVLIDQLREDEAIAEADTLLLTVPNQLGVAYNAHVIEAILTRIAPALGWR